MNENTKQHACFNQAELLDALIKKLNLKNDAALARVLGIGSPTISNIRHRRLPVGASLLIRMHEESGMSIKDLRGMMGDHRPMFKAISQKELQRGAILSHENGRCKQKPLTQYLRKDRAH